MQASVEDASQSAATVTTAAAAAIYYVYSFSNRSMARRSVSSFLAKQKRTTR
jgi:hypothetical protein